MADGDQAVDVSVPVGDAGGLPEPGAVLPAWLPRGGLYVALGLLVAGIVALAGLVYAAATTDWPNDAVELGVAGAGVAVLMGLGVGGLAWSISYSRLQQTRSAQQERIRRSEVQAARQPGRVAASWDVAVVKLESYLDRNLDQVRAIFYLSCAVMVGGFCLIAGGVVLAFLDAWGGMPLAPGADPAAEGGGLSIATVSAGSGVLVEFIGATLMVIYRSTMTQAASYMKVLERINAVGMSVQIIESVEGDDALRNQALVSVAERMLQMYGDASWQDGSSPASTEDPPAGADLSVG